MYFWIVAIDDSWFKYDSLEMQQTDWLSGATRSPWARIGGWLTPVQAIWRPTLSCWVIFFNGYASQREASFCWLKIIEISIAKFAISPFPVISSLAHPWWRQAPCHRFSHEHPEWARVVDSWNISPQLQDKKQEFLRWSREELYGPKVYRPKQNQFNRRCYMAMNYHKL